MRSFPAGRFVMAGVASLALVLSGAAPALAAPASVTRTYAGTDAVIANPGRGFFTYTETHLRGDGSGWEPLAAADLTAAGHTLVFRIVYLEKYQAVDTISAADLDRFRADLTTARKAGVKLVLRFAYTADSDHDATPDRTVGHIQQIGNAISADADVVAAVQAGFIGRWGEWYYTRNFTRTDQSDRKRVLDALLAAVPSTVPVQVRTPAFARRLAPGNTRVGVHDDCFLAGDDDYGTYAGDDRAWLAARGATTLVGGETCDPSARSGWANANKEMAAYHWTYLNPSFNADVLDSWGATGRTEAAKRLGYRLRLVKAVLPASAKAGAKVRVSFTITNLGYAAPVQNRPVRLLVGSRAVTLATDVRTWLPGRTVTVTGTFTAPAGSYPLALSLPDPSPRLASTPAYAIQLANTGLWNATTGRNSLKATLKVTR
ncbi:DUF4832 domain-containing protein [Actinoplanes couchii]|nr:DUF4832 domain-containing protein [Actinoplanes couchii]MDR6322317.1 hypothetical protein [Actinoplanes couchii]